MIYYSLKYIKGVISINITPEQYRKMTSQVSPKSKSYVNVPVAFVTGGGICVIGQLLINAFEKSGMEKELAGMWTSVILIALSALFTGLGLYEKLAGHAGAGTLVPVTGFANAVAAPALEAKTEGFISGTGTKIFTIAGPVILYGTFASFIYGIIYYIMKTQ